MNKSIFRLFTPLFTVMCISVIFILPGSASAEMEKEIPHLLNYIATSDCVFIRNNSRHAPVKAAEHIERKYNHLKKRIKTTEDFIKGAATKSSMSGKPYTVFCNDHEMATANWLRAELARYRSKMLSQEGVHDSSPIPSAANPTAQ